MSHTKDLPVEYTWVQSFRSVSIRSSCGSSMSVFTTRGTSSCQSKIRSSVVCETEKNHVQKVKRDIMEKTYVNIQPFNMLK